MRAFRSASMADTGLNANDQMIAKKRMKLSALTITQNRLIWNSVLAPPSSAASWMTVWPAPAATARMSTGTRWPAG